ncbi:MAG: flagellar biosynthesis/type III secretory pathway M-ring protein FliF/YscJ [Planctomycetota bacterium]|jgi:flagellar biosynthesis/type III secretory pathway M-ring protein FliF/YscJ
MKERLLQLLELFKSARPATQITLVLGTLAIFAVAGISSWLANRPDMVLLWSELASPQAAEYKKALAQANIAFISSPPPENGIWVNASQRIDAEAQVALGGFMPTLKGIQVSDGGVGSAFLSARNRGQQADKREWQECEKQLERLNFVHQATVCSSARESSPFMSGTNPTISVTLELVHGFALDVSQARTVATLVRSRFNVPLENITIVDQHGNLLHDGAEEGQGLNGKDLFALQRRYDSDAERRANQNLEMAFGKGMAHVTVNSTWSYDEFESILESALPDLSAPYYVSKSSSENSDASSSIGGPAGVSSNITQNFGNESAGVGGATEGSGTTESKDEITRSVVGRSTEHRLSRTPKVTRIAVSLIADESIAGKLTELEGMVKAAVGFDEMRNDYFESYTTTLASVTRDADGAPIMPKEPEPAAPPNRYLELAIKHGVEILAALAFLFVLMKSLKGVKQAAGNTGGAHASAADQLDAMLEPQPIDMEMLARAQVEDLVRSDPEKVSSILASWVSGAEDGVGAGR